MSLQHKTIPQNRGEKFTFVGNACFCSELENSFTACVAVSGKQQDKFTMPKLVPPYTYVWKLDLENCDIHIEE